ncbi:MAG: hypothetical protein AAFV74_19955 [Pseudomonadota bacterium]
MTELEAMELAAAAQKRKQEAAAQMTAGDTQTQPQSSAGDTEAKRRKLRLLQEQARVRANPSTYEELIAKARELDAAGDAAGAKRLAQIAISRRDQAKPAQAANKTGQIFEIQADDGTVYEVQADSIEQAAATVNGLGSKDKPWGQVLKENLIGDNDPTTQNFGEKVGSFLNKAGESFFLGTVGDETSARLESALSGVDYEQRRDHYRQQEQQFEEQHPLASFIAELAPLAVPATGIANAATRGTNLGLATLRGGALAGAQGATYGFMEGEGGFENRLSDAGNAGALSAGLGMAATPLTRGAQRMADNHAFKKAGKQMAKTAPSVDDLTSQAAALYGKGEARGQILTREAAKGLADDVMASLREKGVMRSNGQLITRDPDVRRVVAELQDLAEFGLEGNQVKPVRSLFQAAASDRDPTRARIGKILLDKFDDAVKRSAPEFAEGDALYHRAKKVQSVDQMIDLADTSDTANALRREFQKVDRKNIKGQTGMTPDEVTAMQRVARGSRAEGLARMLGRSAPRSVSGALFSGSTPFVAGSLAGSPGIGAAVGATAMGAGMLGRAYSNREQVVNALMAKGLMAQGGKMPKAEASLAVRQAIARALMGLAPRAGEGFTGGP